MSANFARIVTEDRRLTLLKVLDGSPERRANHYVLQTILGEVGHAVSRDQVLADLAWLQDLQLLHTEVLTGADCPITVAALLSRGEDVATGRAVVPGIKRPLPGE